MALTLWIALQDTTLGLAQVGVASCMWQNIASEFLSSATGVYHASAGLFAALPILVGVTLYPISSSYVFFFTATHCAFAAIVATMILGKDDRDAAGGPNDSTSG